MNANDSNAAMPNRENEPIHSRPAGALERSYKWVKQNKMGAGAMAAVSLALLVGTSVSLGFGLGVHRKQKDIDAATEREKGEAARADRERAGAIHARRDLQRTLAKALLGPVTADQRDSQLTPYEVEAVWQIAELRRDDVAWMVIEEATRTPLTCKQLECRAEYVFHAALGLDLAQRDAVDQLFLSQLREPSTHGNRAVSLALAVSRANLASPQTAAAAARALTDALAQATNPAALDILARSLATVAARMEPAEANTVCARAVHILTDALAKETDRYAHTRLAPVLVAVAAHMAPAEAARVLTEALDRAATARADLAEGLSGVAARMAPAEANSVCASAARTLATALANADEQDRRSLARGLFAVAARMEPGEAVRALTDALAGYTVRPPRQAVVAGSDIILGGFMIVDPDGRDELRKGLSVVAARMEPTEAARVLMDALTTQTNSRARGDWAHVLAEVATRLEPAAAAKVLSQTAHTLTAAIAKEKEKGGYASNSLVEDLIASLAAVAVRMGTEAAVNTLTDALAKQTHLYYDSRLAEGFVTVAARAESAEAVCILTDALAKQTLPQDRRRLAEGLAVAAARMEPAEAVRVYAQATRTLANALDTETDTREYGRWAKSLATVSARIEPAEAMRVCARATRTLANALAKERNSDDRAELAESVAALAVRMEPAEAAAVCAEAARTLTDALANSKNSGSSSPRRLAEGLVAVLARMEPAAAINVCTQAVYILVGALAREKDYFARELAAGLTVLATRLEPAEAARILMDALAKQTHADARNNLAEGLAAVSARMKPTEGAAVLADALAKETDAGARRSLAEGLAAVSVRMEPTEATRVCAQAARVLANVLPETTEVLPHNRGRGMASVALGLPSDVRSRTQHIPILATGAFTTPHNLLPSLPLLHPYFQPQTRPLPPQTLVELLKHPFCIGEVRRAVLDALEFTYKRPFKDQWDFVEYAQKHQPQLDLLTPPKRPQP